MLIARSIMTSSFHAPCLVIVPSPSGLTPSQMALNNLPPLKHITRLQRLPPIHRAHFHTHKVFIRIRRLQIRHRLILLHPRIPHHRIFQIIASNVKARLAARGDGSRVLLNGLVNAVDFAGDGEGGGGLRVLGGVEDFVDVGCAA